MAEANPIQLTADLKARFSGATQKRGHEECWEWLGRKNSAGYGVMNCNGRRVMAHRVSVIVSGRDIPAGQVCDHMCRNKSCVNPSHIRVVSSRTNTIENSTSNAALNLVKTHCPKGHELSGDNLYVSTRRGGKERCCRTCKNASTLEWNARRPHLRAQEGSAGGAS